MMVPIRERDILVGVLDALATLDRIDVRPDGFEHCVNLHKGRGGVHLVAYSVSKFIDDRTRKVMAHQVVVLYPDDIGPKSDRESDYIGPAMQHGFSIYYNIVVVWDEDYDTRILSFIDQIYQKDWGYSELLMIGERNGNITMLWKGGVPSFLAKDTEHIVIGDPWIVRESRSILAHNPYWE